MERVKYSTLTLTILATTFGLSLLFQNVFLVREHVTTVFVFAVFLVSLWTPGYAYGIVAAILSTLAVNYAFTFPFFAFNFTLSSNLVSAVVMIVLAALTCTLTTKIKHQEAVKAEGERERMRANLLRAISHDLRTPLTTIYSSCSALLERRESLSVPQQNKMLEGIREDSEWLVRMVENLLSVTRIDSGQVQLVKEPTVLEELIDSVVQKFQKRYPDQEVELELPEDIVLIPMDPMLIEQVLTNLLENAIYHAKGMQRLCLRVFTLGDRAIFEVRDDGCGIDEALLKDIFNGRALGSAVPADGKKRSAGIGLSVCASIIKAHGGNISAENSSGGGAVLRFSLTMEEDAHE